MGNIGFPEMVVIFILALLIFGPKRLPELGKSLGKGIGEFRRASSDLRNTIEREIESAQIPTHNPIKEVVNDIRKAATETVTEASNTLSNANKSLTSGADSPKA
jgi:sec-independent protein translocase protein TatA